MSCSSDTANAFLTRAGSAPCWSSLSRCAGRSTNFSTERKMNILVVEDEIYQQEWLTRNLSNTGHEVTTACDGDRSRPTVHHADGLYSISVNFAEAAQLVATA